MPAAINAFLKEDSLEDSARVHLRILQAYENDFGKYAKVSQDKYLHSIFRKAPLYIAQVLKYAPLDPDAKAKDLKTVISTTVFLNVINRKGYYLF
jgi:hypothetical protein